MVEQSERGERIWAAALALVGVRFRLHGRDAVGGLDCVGLAALAYRMAGVPLGDVPDRYALRGRDERLFSQWLAAAGLAPVARDDWRTGDVLLADMGAGQWHLMIGGRGDVAGGDAVIHAHAGLRRVVMMPGAPPQGAAGRMVSVWRGGGADIER